MKRYISYKLNSLISSWIQLVYRNCNHKRFNFYGVMSVFILLSIGNLAIYTNYGISAIPVEVTGKVIINPPKCSHDEEYNAGLDECTPKNLPNPDPNTPDQRTDTPAAIRPRPIVPPLNAS